ncbi:hypothetical protein GQ55_9G354700 [Panicum hallii var. hallii]|uniref:Uncharacterized protein n=1 Tax=Panicum hallii var. hallii TaxID=1504633 RepID=A0A2T7C8L8_9POAL|nr:hypothetical protein GQ55_9G354700 [Panicum hallii var. hallii]
MRAITRSIPPPYTAPGDHLGLAPPSSVGPALHHRSQPYEPWVSLAALPPSSRAGPAPACLPRRRCRRPDAAKLWPRVVRRGRGQGGFAGIFRSRAPPAAGSTGGEAVERSTGHLRGRGAASSTWLPASSAAPSPVGAAGTPVLPSGSQPPLGSWSSPSSSPAEVGSNLRCGGDEGRRRSWPRSGAACSRRRGSFRAAE